MKKINHWVRKIITPKILAYFLTVIYIISLIPIIMISGYNYPSADDYTNGYRGYLTWNETHSIGAVLGEAFRRAANEYMEWRGCFTSSFLSALPPSIFGERWCFVTTLIMLILLSTATMYLFYCIIVKVFKSDKYTSRCISMLVLLMAVQCMGTGLRTEFLFWFSGAINYAFIHGLEMFFCGILISIACDKEKKHVWKLIVASILGFLIAGGNQMSSLNALIVIVTVALIITKQKKWKEYHRLLIPLGVYVISIILSFAAPGNWVRARASDMMSPIKAIFVSFYYCLDLALSEWTTWPVIVMVIMMIPFFWSIAEKVEFRFPCPLIVLGFGYCIASAMMTPPLFAVGNIEAGRIQALTYWMYILLLTLSVGYMTGWCQKKCGKSYVGFSDEMRWCLTGCILFLGFGSVITIIPEPYYYTTTSAITDLANGKAKGFAQEMEDRIEIYKSNQGGSVVVDELANQPELLFFSDVKTDSQDWENLGIARYYGMDSIALQKREAR